MASETEIHAIPVTEVPVEEALLLLDELKLRLLESTVTTHHQLESIVSPILRSRTCRRIYSGCEIIYRSVLTEFGRIIAAEPTPEHPMQALATHCQDIRQRWLEGPRKILNYLQPFLQRAHTVLIHGHSSVICDSLVHAFAAHKMKFIFTEGAPLFTGRQSVAYVTARWEEKTGNTDISEYLSIIPDSAAAVTIPSVNFILVPATAVTISGGAAGMIGCHQLAILAHALGKDFYAIAEVFRFSRIFPLNSKDIRPTDTDETASALSGDTEHTSLLEYIPPTRIVMYFTNIGLFPPVTAADEVYNIFFGDCSGKNPLVK
ncbi:eIF2B-alpha protein [Perkinsela sp. CCAP 1560/4]|nr:eIF2B-alpha protein [Perkinsela sp. CCAP 1560/4]KNH08424.1 eIF2B-alpha protein [Perkinsela sp. CCAP 1560/4]|eukprot:KNH06954.1 eIF2B-alpha protein [Perkinsela sp. CCAP 1560/4]